jgi:hypothetical protein
MLSFHTIPHFEPLSRVYLKDFFTYSHEHISCLENTSTNREQSVYTHMKRCSLCQQEVCNSLFFKSNKSKDGLGAYCKPCSIKKRKEWAKENPDKQRAYRKDNWLKRGKVYEENKRKNPEFKAKKKAQNKLRWDLEREKYFEFKQNLSCEKCGLSDFRVLQFHHKDPSQKSFTVSQKAGRIRFDLLKKEIDKCSVLCSNCHIILHFEERGDFDILP